MFDCCNVATEKEHCVDVRLTFWIWTSWDQAIRFCTPGIKMFLIQVTWKAEWVGGLTLEAHPASKTQRCCATQRQRKFKFKLNWILSNTEELTQDICFLILITASNKRKMRCFDSGCLPVLESCCFSLFLLFFLPCRTKKRPPPETWVWLSCRNDWIAINVPSGL